MPDHLFIQDRFTIIDPATGASFTDALILPKEEYEALSQEKITTLKQERFTNWKTLISTPDEGA